MKKLNDYKADIHKCSKCGLCQSVCPIYELTGNDCAVSRGKFIMLNGVAKGDLKNSKTIAKYMDMCLKCNACKDFCPSGIDAAKIFLSAKADYFEKSKFSFITKFFQSQQVFNAILSCIKLASTIYRALKIDKLAEKFYPILKKFGWLGKKIILANEFLRSSTELKKAPQIKTPQSNSASTKKVKVIYFKGCVNESVNPKVKTAVENILEKLNIEIIPIDFQCCGIPFLSSGNANQFKKQAKFNISQIPKDFDFFLTDCASCQDAFLNYKNYLDDENLLNKLGKINEKSINVVEFLSTFVHTIEFEKNTSITFHKPCHLKDTKFVFDIISKMKNVNYVQMNDYDKCCGFAGEFAIKNAELSTKLSSQKARNAIKTNADYILSTCPSCTLGITQGLIEINEQKPVLNIIEFISLAKTIELKYEILNSKENLSQQNELVQI